MFKLRNLALIAGLFAAAACSKDESRSNAENAAEQVRDKSEDLADKANDLKETANDNAGELAEQTEDRAAANAEKAADNVEDLKDETKPLSKEAIALRDAQKEFEYQRLVRVQTLRVSHAIAASQLMLINAVGQSTALVDADRAKLDEKLHLFQMRLDESANLVQGLDGVEAARWEARDKAAADAMNRMEDSRAGAWEALDEADRLDDVSMR